MTLFEKMTTTATGKLKVHASGTWNWSRFFLHRNPMRTHCQFTVKRSEKKGRFNCCPEQQPCGVQVVERVGLVASE
jgi:hypothetical protein